MTFTAHSNATSSPASPSPSNDNEKFMRSIIRNRYTAQSLEPSYSSPTPSLMTEILSRIFGKISPTAKPCIANSGSAYRRRQLVSGRFFSGALRPRPRDSWAMMKSLSWMIVFRVCFSFTTPGIAPLYNAKR